MRKIVFAVMAATLSLSAMANVEILFPKEMNGKKIGVESILISDMVKPRAERPKTTIDSLVVKKGKITLAQPTTGNASYMIRTGQNEAISFYTQPGETLKVSIKSYSPLEYTVTGSELMKQITDLRTSGNSIAAEYRRAAEAKDEKAAEVAITKYYSFFSDFIKNNPTAPGALYAIQNLTPDAFMEAFTALPESQKSGVLYPLVEMQKKSVDRQIEADRKQKELQSGSVAAPNFTLKNLEGKDVSLSDFKGKWVILDFWGSWCRWCIKGFPELKAAYAKYAPELEVIGIDCQDSDQAWRNAVKKYELPWVHVYYNNSADSNKLMTDYAVTGFPTKFIINPEGKIVNMTVGENPAFFEELAKLMGK